MGQRWVIGDIHGCIGTFRKMVEQEICLEKEDTLFLLGDLIDRGPDSKAVIDFIFCLQEQSFNILVLMGNHEWMLLESLTSREMFALWMRNKGITTLHDFGIALDKDRDPAAVIQIPSRYLDFFQGLPSFVETDGFFLVHAGLNPYCENPLEDRETMLWTREEGYPADFLKGRKLVHGHSPIPLNEIVKRLSNVNTLVYNLDGGCVYPHIPGFGNLIAWNLDTGALKVLKNQE
ncbi:MAG: metallophosphoesterase family protein [bacterium]